MNELGKFFNSIMDRIKGFFEVIDLSMFIAGTLGLLIIYWWQFLNSFTFEILHLKEYNLVIHIILAYGIGLICFAGGRTLRRFVLKLLKSSDDITDYLQKIKDHELHEDINIKRYLTSLGSNSISIKESSRKSLREFLWSDIRQNKEYGYSILFLNKYWSMSVIFDSLLGCSFLIDITMIDIFSNIYGKYNFHTDHQLIIWVFVIGVSFLIKSCLINLAKIYDKYQDDELLASYAALKRKREYDSSIQRL